ASFQEAVIKPLVANTEKAINEYEIKSLSLAGGVAANSALRESFIELSKRYNKKVVIPGLEYCGDNAAMIAYRGVKLFEAGERHNLKFSPFPGLTAENFI
ncbi:MAG: tRNA (adenosine(37)-N6)-threonylcarbamoyltransferase complex transferase subunit TsaD, partial [Ignavibacteriaceae bacterium]